MTELWPLVPNWASGLKETYEFRTEIITSRSGKEQRRALRTTPRRSVGYDSIVTDDALRRMEGQLARSQESLMLGADFVRGVKTTSALPITGNTVQVRSVPAWLTVGAKVALSYRRTSRLFTVQNIAGTTLTFIEPAEVGFGAGSRISRVVAGYVEPSLQTTRVTGTVATVATVFEPDPATEPVDEGAIDPSAWFDGREIFMARPNWTRSPTVTFAHDIETVDYGRGRTRRFTPVTFGTTTRQATYLGRSIAEMDSVRQFFARRKGRRGEFYLPTWSDDMVLAAPVPAMTNQMRIAGRQVFDDYSSDTARRSILAVNKDGSAIAFKFDSITLSGGDSVLHLTDTFPFDILPSDVKQVCWLQLSRFASDTLTVEWVSDGVAQCALSITSLEYADAEPTDLGEWDALTLYMLSTFGWDFTENVLTDPLQWAVNVRYPDIAEVT